MAIAPQNYYHLFFLSKYIERKQMANTHKLHWGKITALYVTSAILKNQC